MKPKLLTLAALLALQSALLPRATADVRVYGLASSDGNSIRVDAYADIVQTPVISFGLKLYYDDKLLQVISASQEHSTWFFHDGTTRLPGPAPDVSQPGEVVLLGAKLDGRNPRTAIEGKGILLGTVVFARHTPDAPRFRINLGREGNFANFVTPEGQVLEAKRGVVQFEEIKPDPEDEDLDGLQDAWEREMFNTTDAFYTDDPDQDGYSNGDESKLGSDPMNGDSNMNLAVHQEKGQVVLQWSSHEKRRYTIEIGEGLKSFHPLKTGIEATPPINTYVVETPNGPQKNFYRVLLEPR